MDRYCPECNATMTPSLVGYLCSNCGNMQRFHTQTATISPRIEVLPTSSEDSLDNTAEPDSKPEAKPNNKVKSTLKRLMVPELSPPHHEQLIAEGNQDQSLPAQKADKLPDEFDVATTGTTSKAYQPDQIADDFDSSKPKENPAKHSNAWIWATLVLFVVATISLGAIYFLYNR